MLVMAQALPAWLSGQSPEESRHPLAEVNTPWIETRPSISLDGSMLYFSRLGYPSNMGTADEADIWVCYVSQDSITSSPVNVGAPINSVFPDYLVGNGISGDFLQAMRLEELPSFFSVEGNPRQRSVEELPSPALFFPDASDYFISSNKRLLFFSMASPDGLGGQDIYLAHREPDGSWGKARNLGAAINSRGDETAPFLAADGKTLYFSSDGRGGFGGKDLFVSFSMSDEHWNEWTIPQNLGPGINAATDERYPTLPASGRQLFFVVQVPGTDSSDLYRALLPQIFRPQPTLIVSGLDHSQLQIRRADPELGFLPDLYVTLEEAAGKFQLALPTGSNVTITAEEPGYFWCTHTLELGYEPMESLDRDSMFTSTLSNNPEYLSREAELIQLHQEWIEKRESVATIAQNQNRLLEVIRHKTLQMPLISPDPSLEVNRILLMLSALPDTFVQQISKVLNEKLSALQHPDSLLAGKTERENLLSPEAEKQLNQQLVFDLKTYIDAHNRQELLEQQQVLLELAVKERTESQITMERQVSRKTKEEGRTTPLQNVNPSRADKAQPFKQLFLTCPKIPVQAGSKMILQSIYFEENTAVLKSSAENELQRLIDFLKKNATIVLEIGAHTHTQLAHAFADPISARRAKAVVDYIAEHGIDRNRMLAAGYGKKQPLVLPDTDPEQQKINQRIEIRILK